MIANASILYVNWYSNPLTSQDLIWSDYVGIAVWFLGIAIESVADQQLANHINSPQPGAGKFCKSGLWKYSRHPNYFGEIVLWIGLYIISTGEEKGWITFFAPIYIFAMIRFLSGVPF